MPTFNAIKFLGNGTPAEEGQRLANIILVQFNKFDELDIDLQKHPPDILISAFFIAFLQNIHNNKPELLKHVPKIKWYCSYPFQERNIDRWVDEFKPWKKIMTLEEIQKRISEIEKCVQGEFFSAARIKTDNLYLDFVKFVSENPDQNLIASTTKLSNLAKEILKAEALIDGKQDE